MVNESAIGFLGAGAQRQVFQTNGAFQIIAINVELWCRSLPFIDYLLNALFLEDAFSFFRRFTEKLLRSKKVIFEFVIVFVIANCF
jgi:hypothetical protein